jgi:hypothetical protein
VAPWNIHLYDFKDFGKIYFENKEIEIIFFHYHGTRISLEKNELNIYLIDSDFNESLKQNIYIPYLQLLSEIYNKFLFQKVDKYQVFGRSLSNKIFAKVKFYLRDNRIIRFIYYNLLKVKYNGYEK